MTLPDDVDWYIHEVLTSEHYKISMVELDQQSLDDLFDMHAVIDVLEAQKSFAYARR